MKITSALILFAGFSLCGYAIEWNILLDGKINEQRAFTRAIAKENVAMQPDLTILHQALSKNKDPEALYYLLSYIADLGEKASPLLSDAVDLLSSNDTKVRLAAIEVVINIGKPCPAAVIPLRDLIIKYASDRQLSIIAGSSAAALTVVTDEPEVFRMLLNHPNGQVANTMAVALQDSILWKQFEPEFKWRLPYYDGSCQSKVINGSFENSPSDLTGWEIRYIDGAKGRFAIDTAIKRSGTQSLGISKDNAMGFIELRSKEYITVPANDVWTWRGFYHSENLVAGQSILLFRLEDGDGGIKSFDTVPRAGWGAQGQSYVCNAATGEWRKRLLILPAAPKERRFKLVIRWYGCPGSIHLDDLTFPSSAWHYAFSAPVPEVPQHISVDTRQILASRQEAEAKLAKSSNGNVVIMINNKESSPILYFPFRPRLGDYRAMSASGIKIHNVVLSINDFLGEYNNSDLNGSGGGPVWPSAKGKKYYFDSLLKQIEKIALQIPDDYIILGFHLAWPADYVDVHPECGWQNENGQYAYGNVLFQTGFSKLEKIPSGNILWPSPYHNRPFDDMEELLRAFVRELKKTPYAKMVIGCFVSGGHDGQFEVIKRDFSPSATEKWRNFLCSKYIDEKKLQVAWHNPQIKISSAKVPIDYHGSLRTTDALPIFYSPVTEAADRDYEQYRQERIWEIKSRLISAVKNEFNKPMLGVTWLMGGTAVKYVKPFLDSKALDMVVVQPGYANRMPGMIGGVLWAEESFKCHNKLFFKEFDFRSFVRETYYNELASTKIGTPLTVADWQHVNRREAGQLITKNGGWWYYDISHNAFNQPDIRKEIKQTTLICSKLQQETNIPFRPDVAVILNDRTNFSMRTSLYGATNQIAMMLKNQIYDLFSSGVPFDTWYLDDLLASNTEYKMYLFLNAYEVSNEERDLINARLKKDGKTLIWHYMSGFLDKTKGYELKGVKDLTGFEVELHDKKVHNYRTISAVNDFTRQYALTNQATSGDVASSIFTSSVMDVLRMNIKGGDNFTVLSNYLDDNAIAGALRRNTNWKSVLVTALAGINSQMLNALARDCNCYVVAPAGQMQIDINGNFLSVYALSTGKFILKLPRQCQVIDAFNGSKVQVNDMTMALNMNAGECRWFYLQ